MPVPSPSRAQLESIVAPLHCQYALYFRRGKGEPFLLANCERFVAASLIKVPILFAWAHLEALGELSGDERCELDVEPPVQGAGFSWLLRTRRLNMRDALLLMIAVSDNLCTNLVIRRAGMERLNDTFKNALGLKDTHLGRVMMDFGARQAGHENWISAADCVRLFRLRHRLPAAQRTWIEPLLLANQDPSLLLRDLSPDTLPVWHKTASLPGVLHDWGYTEHDQLFLLTQEVVDYAPVYAAFGAAGRLLAT